MSTGQFNLSSEEARKGAQQDLNFLGMLSMPEYFLFAFPAFYITLFNILVNSQKRFAHYALGIPRGFAKTTFMKLLCLWYILFSDKRFILIVCAAEDLAINIVTDVCDMLSHPNIVQLFGSWEQNCSEDQKHKKVFFFRGRTIIIQGIGAESSVRGINRSHSRPDVMVMDDIQKKEDAVNPELAKKLMTWMVGTLMKAKSEKGCTFIFVGNMYPQNSILEKLKGAKNWTSFIVGGILQDGQSLWEELKPIEELLEEWESDKDLGCEDVFLSEILNSTEIELPSGVKLESIPQCPDYYDSVPADGNYILIDPSGEKKSSDDCTINYFEVKDGKSILTDITYGVFSPLETIKKALSVAMDNNCRLICVEDVAYQSSLLFWFNYYCEQHGIIGFEFQPVSPRGQAKNRRIKRGVTRVLAGEVLLHNKVRSLVLDQYSTWNPLKTNNKDDLIDPIGYAEEVEQKYSHLMCTVLNLEDNSGDASEAIEMSF